MGSSGANGAGRAPIDLRSDTVTRPTPAMRAAMAAAEVGDDVYREDPTVRRLEEATAARFGRQAALFCPSGVMCNQIALQVLAPAGTEVIVEADSHLANYEAGAAAVWSRAQLRTVPTARGQLSPAQVAAWIHPTDGLVTPTSVLWLEQTHNRHGGTFYDVAQLAALRELADDHGLAVYMDGARVWNAAVASGTDPATYAGAVDLLMCCVSKGLGAPVGSLLVGDRAELDAARRWRQRFGGAMRQAGVVAAAGLVALAEMVERLADDHEAARVLATAAAEAHPGGVDLDAVVTNIVYLTDTDAPAVVAALRERRVLVGAMDARTVRLVTHADVRPDDLLRACDALRDVLGGA